MPTIAKSCNQSNFSASNYKAKYTQTCIYVYVLKSWWKHKEKLKNAHTQTHTHTGALSTAPFQWLTGQPRETDMERKRLRQTGDVLGKDNLFKSLTRTGKNKQKNKQKFVHDFLKSFQFCLKIVTFNRNKTKSHTITHPHEFIRKISTVSENSKLWCQIWHQSKAKATKKKSKEQFHFVRLT